MKNESLGTTIARSILGIVLSGIACVFLSVYTVKDWATENLRDHPVEFITGFLISASFGGAMTYFLYWAYMKRQKEKEACSHKSELAAKDTEIDSLKVSHEHELEKLRGDKRTMDSLFREFSSLTHDEQRSVVDVYLSEPRGIEPTDEQRARMGDWVKMKDFLRRDPVTDTLHLKDDGVRRMLLENPVHVYDLMAARVADLESRLDDAKKEIGLTADNCEANQDCSTKDPDREGKKRQVEQDDAVRSFCKTFSARKRAIVLEALDHGDLDLSALDSEVTSLCDGGILKASPIQGVLTGGSFFINPEHVDRLSEHRSEWLGDIEPGERLRLIYGESPTKHGEDNEEWY